MHAGAVGVSGHGNGTAIREDEPARPLAPPSEERADTESSKAAFPTTPTFPTPGSKRPRGISAPNVQAPASKWQGVAKISWGGFTLVLLGLPILAYGWWVAFVRLCDSGSGGEPGNCSPIGLAAPYLVVGAGLLVVGVVMLTIGYNARHRRVTRPNLLQPNLKS